MTNLCLHDNPHGKGTIEFAAGRLIITNEDFDGEAVVWIGPNGMRDLARRLAALADVIDGGQK